MGDFGWKVENREARDAAEILLDKIPVFAYNKDAAVAAWKKRWSLPGKWERKF